MKKTLSENFVTTIRNGELVFAQSCSDLKVATRIILDMVDDVTKEEYKVLSEAMQILRKYDE